MASTMVSKFHARDAEGRIYSVHEFQDLQQSEAGDTKPVSVYKLAIGDRVNHLGGDEFQLVQSGITMTRTP